MKKTQDEKIKITLNFGNPKRAKLPKGQRVLGSATTLQGLSWQMRRLKAVPWVEGMAYPVHEDDDQIWVIHRGRLYSMWAEEHYTPKTNSCIHVPCRRYFPKPKKS